MAKDTGKNYRRGSVSKRTQVRNPKAKVWVKRNEKPGSKHRGEFMEVKESGRPFKGVAREVDHRRD